MWKKRRKTNRAASFLDFYWAPSKAWFGFLNCGFQPQLLHSVNEFMDKLPTNNEQFGDFIYDS